MINCSRFVIQNDLSGSIIVNIEPESFHVSLASGEKVTVQETFQKEPLTLKLESDKGDTFVSLWPGDGEVQVEKNGVNIFDLVEKDVGGDGLVSHALKDDARPAPRTDLGHKT